MNKNLLRGSLETIILTILSEHGEMYGYEMTKMVKETTDEKILITEGALYPALHKLEAKGVISSSTRSVGNRFRKYYHLTESGKKEVSKVLSDMKEYFDAMSLILNKKLSI